MSFLLRSTGLLIFILAFGAGLFMGKVYATTNGEKIVQSSQPKNVIPFPQGEEALREMAADMMKNHDWQNSQQLQDIAPASGE